MTQLRSLIRRLNDPARRALEGGAALCLSRTNYDVDIEHVLFKLLEMSNTDVHRVLAHFEVDQARLVRDLTRALDRLKTGNARTPAFSPRLPELLSHAWLIASIDSDSPAIRTGHLLLALLTRDDIAALTLDTVPELARVKPATLREQFDRIVAGSIEDQGTACSAEGIRTGADQGTVATPALDQFTVDLTARARQGHIDPVTGRDSEIRQLIDILMRRRQNNPILTGEAGVGKTAVVEGFALRVAEGCVPPPLAGVSVRTLDMGLLQAGAGIKGEFENRLKTVIEEVKASAQPVILFIDEAHTLIGAGGQAGQNDAANLLKPALARGDLRTIAATTWSEYKKYFEKDAALARRFQVVKVEEPTPEVAMLMMRQLAPRLERHHHVRILDEAVEASVRLSDRYVSGRQLPDKSVSVLDTACARLAIGQSAVPAPVEDARRQLAAAQHEASVLEREHAITPIHADRLASLRQRCGLLASSLSALEARWDAERGLIERIRVCRGALEVSGCQRSGAANGSVAAAGAASNGAVACLEVVNDAAGAAVRDELRQLTSQLCDLQGERPLMHVVVDAQAVAQVVSAWTGIPVGNMKGDEIGTVRTLDERLASRVLGQPQALEVIAERVQISRARLEDERKPIGVFMLVGPSGVGKTETALALADTLYGGEHNLITINMSEYQEPHTVATLKGSPPGYVGFGEGGVLTEAVRRKPYSVVLLDEVEKAHPDVLELFYQVFDKGTLEDGEGREIDFKHTVILLTSNVGSEIVLQMCAKDHPSPDALSRALRPALLECFPPAFLGRLIVIPYYRIADDMLRKIVRLQLDRVAARLRRSHRATLDYDEALADAIKTRCTEVESGARNVEHIISRTLLPEISREVLARMAADLRFSRVRVDVTDAGELRCHAH